MDYKKYLAAELEQAKKDIKLYASGVKSLKAETEKLKKSLSKAEDEDSKDAIQADIHTNKELHASHSNLEFKARKKRDHLEKIIKFEFMKLENGVVIEVSRLRQFLKKFKLYKLNYEYTQTDEGLNIQYDNVPGKVKGKLQLTPSPYEFPEHVTFLSFKESDFNA